MKKKRIYSMGAKIIVVLLLTASAIVAGISGSWIMLGLNHGMGVDEIMSPVSYERSDAAKDYLGREGETILESMGNRKQFCRNGETYNDAETIDIMDISAGVGNEDKNPDTEYTLKALGGFFGSDGYLILEYLTENAESYVEYIEDTYAEDTFPIAEAGEAATESSEGEPSQATGSEAPVSGTETVEIERGEVGGTGRISYTVRCYEDEYDVLYNNGIGIERQYILNAGEQTLAEYARNNPDQVNLYECYQNLLDASRQVHDYESAAEEDTNARLYVRNTDTGDVYTNVSEWSKLTLDQVKENYMDAYGGDGVNVYYYCDEKVSVRETKTETEPAADDEYAIAMGESLLKSAKEQLGNAQYQLFIGLDTNYPLRDSSSYLNMQVYAWYAEHQPFGFLNKVYLFFIALAVLFIMLIISGCQTGHKPEDDEIHPALMDYFPIEIMIAADIVLWAAVMALAADFVGNYYWPDNDSMYYYIRNQFYRGSAEGTAAAVMGTSLLAWELKRYGRRLKAHKLGGSLTRSIARGIRRTAQAAYQAKKENQKLMIAYIGLLALHFVFLLIAGVVGANYMGFLAFCIIAWLIILDICVLNRLLKNIRGRDEIKKGMAEIAQGNLDYRIDTEHMSGDNQVIADELNCVRDGLRQAIEVEMKSERLKTDLITNVSHDIKTPLTSIINYVDILKRENIQDEKIAGYIDILDRKSLRLKQLTEDLVEASKISSGNITLDMQEINLKQLIKQTNGEFEEKFAARNLELVCSLPESEMVIRADGRRMFRVIENLYNNAAKYAMPNSRVYVTGELKGGRVIFSIKNMSERALNFKADELLERFVRGDVSRSTEGSGLGLEIAKNLTNMQDGTFELYLDGDLFKVTITFDAV